VSFLADEQDVRAKIKAQVEQVRAEGREAELVVRSTHAAHDRDGAADERKPPPMKARSDMYETVIWATDGSDGADAALDEALRLTSLSGGHLVAIHSDQRLNGRAGGWPALADEDDLRLKIRRQVEELKKDGVDIDLVIRPSHREAADTVAAVAAALDADAIVCGTRGVSAFAGAFLGSFTQRLLHIAPCPVLAVGPRSELNAVLHHASTGAGA
jgi:nucleotide-binding universal stress UspA family protein